MIRYAKPINILGELVDAILISEILSYKEGYYNLDQ